MPRCIWCHQSTGELRTLLLRNGREHRFVIVHPEHEERVIDWHNFVLTHQASLVLRLALLPLVLLAVIGLASLVNSRLIPIAVGVVVVCVAATVWRFPFATPQTVSLLGVRRSVSISRALAVVLGLLGAILASARLWLPAHVA